MFFDKFVVKVWNPANTGNLQKYVANTLSLLEKEFPLAFFDVMTHLLLHVVDELDVCRPIHNCWMYHVATLTLGSRPRQGLAKVWAKSEAHESHFVHPRM
jgi:hypothetical protein